MILNWIKHVFTERSCIHVWKERLILSGGKNTRHDVRICQRCGKSEVIFSGSRDEWYAHNGYDT